MDYLASNTKMRDKNSSVLFRSFFAISNKLQWYGGPRHNSPKFMNGHINAEIVVTKGLYFRDDIKVGVTPMHQHLIYSDHHHPPEEVYIVLSDGFWQQNRGQWWAPSPGGYVYSMSDTPRHEIG